jgi:hypothetical protein
MKNDKNEQIEKVFYEITEDLNDSIEQGASSSDALVWAVSTAIVHALHKDNSPEVPDPIEHEQFILDQHKQIVEDTLD